MLSGAFKLDFIAVITYFEQTAQNSYLNKFSNIFSKSALIESDHYSGPLSLLYKFLLSKGGKRHYVVNSP